MPEGRQDRRAQRWSKDSSRRWVQRSRRFARENGAALAAVGGHRYGRLAGFTNRKGQHYKADWLQPFVRLRIEWTRRAGRPALLREGSRLVRPSNACFDATPVPRILVGREHWLRELPEGEARVLQLAIDAPPAAVERTEIDASTGYARSSRDAYIQRLAARKLVECVGRGQVRASEARFREGR